MTPTKKGPRAGMARGTAGTRRSLSTDDHDPTSRKSKSLNGGGGINDHDEEAIKVAQYFIEYGTANGRSPAPVSLDAVESVEAEATPPARTRLVLDAALRYARNGWAVFPAPASGKKTGLASAEHSNGSRWGSTKDAGEIKAYWKKWPLANIGIDMEESGLFVVETDTMAGGHRHDGDASLQELTAQHEPLPETRTAVSPSESMHYYFRTPPGVMIKSTTSKLGPGIDVRGAGGMVIAPPSRRPGKPEPYQWIDENVPMADPPEWLVEKVRDDRPTATLTTTFPSNDEPLPGIEVVEGWLRSIPNGADSKFKELMKWKNIGMAVYDATDGSDEGYDLFDAWSKNWPGYSEADTRQAWREICSSPPTKLTWRTLRHEAREEQRARNIEIGNDPGEADLPTILTLDQMIDRLVFVKSANAVADTVTKKICRKEVATDYYAASRHEKKPVLRAWIASPSRRMVDSVTWVPGAKVICQSPSTPEKSFNTWRGLQPMVTPDDWEAQVEPFVEHVKYLVPVENERKRFVEWLAHTVQRSEVLPHTCYLMIAETTGIGRNLLASILVRVLRGYVAASVDLPRLLDGGFNGVLSQKLLAVVDEAKEGSGERRYQRAERLKSVINEETRLINPKYGIQSVEKNCCRWLMFSNHYDAAPFDNNDRRIIIIANPTDRRSPQYYSRLYNLLDDPDFIGSVRCFLEQHDVSSFRPGEHAPMNEAKKQALDEMMSETERAVVEWKADWRPPLALRDQVRRGVADAIAGDPNETHLTKAMNRAGIISTGRRTSRGHGRDSVVIVHPGRRGWDVEMVKRASEEVLIQNTQDPDDPPAAGLRRP